MIDEERSKGDDEERCKGDDEERCKGDVDGGCLFFCNRGKTPRIYNRLAFVNTIAQIFQRYRPQ